MLVCGIKVSHDGGVALVDGSRLVFSVEIEKLENNRRYSPLGRLERVGEILLAHDVDPAEVDAFVVDGWWEEGNGPLPSIATTASERPITLPVAPYVESAAVRDPLHRYDFDAYDFTSGRRGYVSYHHASNHLFGAYCTSPFATRGEGALILVWDGGMTPRLYEVPAGGGVIRSSGPLLPIAGNMFADFCAHFGPFHSPHYQDNGGQYVPEAVHHHLSIAGKAMAYAGLGTVHEAAFEVFDALLRKTDSVSRSTAFVIGQTVAARRDVLVPGLSDADIIATFQGYLGDALLRKMSSHLARRYPGQQPNLGLAGGCALNIKWNSALRRSGLFADVWVPPFPNDSGAAIGTACCEMVRVGSRPALDWSVYSGPSLSAAPPTGWACRPCTEEQLASVLHNEGEPVVVLSGRAELGPRALGNRSILAPAVDSRMKDHLNTIKERAPYRPVSPICLTERAAEVFDPGSRDPYMLFEHHMRSDWAERVPAVVHLDGSARLQTIDAGTDAAAVRILAAYERQTGIPVLCNTSANANGCGFFPSVAAAAAWGRTRYVWSEGFLYTNPRPDVGFRAGRRTHPRETVDVNHS